MRASVSAPAVKHQIRSFARRRGRPTPAQRRKLRDSPWLLSADVSPIDLTRVFGRAAPVWVEIGFGTGETLLRLGATRPELNLLGIEVHRPGIGHLLLELEESGVTNVRLLEGDAVEVLQTRIMASGLNRVLLLFPDPWPKRRHRKRRLLQPDFARLVTSILTTGGRLHFVTDWEDYARQALQVLEAEPGLTNSTAPGQFSNAPDYRVETRFERRGRQLGHRIYDLLYTRV